MTRDQATSELSAAATRQVVDAARHLVERRRWYLGLPADRPLPDRLLATLEAAVGALDHAEASRVRY